MDPNDLPLTFGDRFVRERSDVISVDGVDVYLRLCIPEVAAGAKIQISFERYINFPRQALCVATTKGKFTINGVAAARMVLWADNSPKFIEGPISNRVPAEVVVYNAWERRGGGIDAGLRYAGIRIETLEEDHWRLNCSDGIGEADFADLVVSVKLLRGA
ncbi:hypothetical protein [Amycolatopsis suaedae]|uniref:Uncharacterized protein n=1 Tax=Amycolatopsis suaedae TaxID=2510978 RepID=A0A4Q7J774_9PSEU|nr:hypothetical protein [Amycolatopsis suaedae]RZQ63511.1 hypothetical protein EWH70_13885 [Amycolatopsis suaedae]